MQRGILWGTLTVSLLHDKTEHFPDHLQREHHHVPSTMPLSHPDSECNPSGLRYFIGGDIDVGLVDQARSKFQDAKIHKHYENNRGRHLFVALDDLENFTKTVVDSWLDVRVYYLPIASCADLSVEPGQYQQSRPWPDGRVEGTCSRPYQSPGAARTFTEWH